MNIATITPVRYSYFKDGSPFRDYDRLISHICSLKKQTMEVDIYIGDGSNDHRANSKIKEICDKYGALYISLDLSDVFNRCLMINETFKKIDKKHDYLCLLDMDLVLDPNLISTFFESYNTRKYEVLVSGIHFLTISSTKIFEYESLEDIDINSDFISFFDKKQESRFYTANGLQFLSRDTFERIGGLDNNFNLYCGTDDEILFRLNNFMPTDRAISDRVNFCINDINKPMAFHLYHDSGTLSSQSEEKKFTKFKDIFRQLNRAYLFKVICSGKFKNQDNLKNPGNYLCKNKEGKYFWGNEESVILNEDEINLSSLFEHYIKNKESCL